MTDASTPLPLSRADRSQWQQEAENEVVACLERHQQPCGYSTCRMARQTVVLLSALQAQEQELARWKVCENCHEPLSGPGICDKAISESEKGLELMLDEQLARAEAAEALAVALRSDIDRLQDAVRAEHQRVVQSLAALTREKERLMAALATARDEQAGFTVTDDIKRICDGYRQMTLNMSESRDELKHENRHLKDELSALTAAYESLKGEHERLTADSKWSIDRLKSDVVFLSEALTEAKRARAAIERQAITETLQAVEALIEPCSVVAPSIGISAFQFREALLKLRPPSPAGTEP